MQKYKNIKKVGLSIICFEGTEHLYNIITAIRDSVDYVSVGLQRLSYHGDPMRLIDIQEIFRLRNEDHLVDNIVEIELDTTKKAREQETDKRNILIQDAEDHGCSHVIVIDSDEYYTKKSFEYGLQQIDENDYEITYCQYVNYYHDYNHYMVYPFSTGMYVPFVSKTKYRHSFECEDFNKPSDPTRRYVRPANITKYIGEDGKEHTKKEYLVDYHIFEWNEVKMHHLSWLRADIRKKLENWSSKLLFDNYEDLIDKSVHNFNNFNEEEKQSQAILLFNTPDNKVDIASFPKQFIHPAVDFRTRLRPAYEPKKLLFLSMSADQEPFNTLEEVSNQTWRNVDKEKYPNMNVEFWTYTDTEPDKEAYVDYEKHIIYIPLDNSTISSVHSTYSKTMEALFIIRDTLKLEYDYLVRTNNSTWLNVPLINDFFAYEDDDSKIYAGRLYSAFHSAFNIYAGGQLMIFPKRQVDILLNTIGSVKNAKAFERKMASCDDNSIGGMINTRLIKLGLKYDKVYHSIGCEEYTEQEIADLDDIDFSVPAHQIKTFLTTVENRVKYDSVKMKQVDEKWRNGEWDLGKLLKELKEKHYDRDITVIKILKQDWLNMDDTEKQKMRFVEPMERNEALQFLKQYQVVAGYTRGCY